MEEYDVDRTPYLIYGGATLAYWSINTIVGYLAWSLSFGTNSLYSSAGRIIFMWAFDFAFQPFMAPISIWWLLSLFIPGIFKVMYRFWNSWSLAGVFFFNFIGLYWLDFWIWWAARLLGETNASAIYALLPAFRAWFWTKTVLLLAHFTVFFIYHKKYSKYIDYMKKCPTNDCKVRKAAKATAAKEAKNEAVDDSIVDVDDADFFSGFEL